MKRPNLEDYHQDKTGENLINPPYNRTRYSDDLEKYIDYLESKQKLNLSGIGSKKPCKWNGNLDACGNEVCWDLQECQGNPVACASGGEDTVAEGGHVHNFVTTVDGEEFCTICTPKIKPARKSSEGQP